MIYLIEDDNLMADCIISSLKGYDVRHFENAIAAIQHLDTHPPALIFLDVLLPGPDGFTFLNELASYEDTAKIPIILVTSLDLSSHDLSAYNVKAVLNKETMTPQDFQTLAQEFAHV